MSWDAWIQERVDVENEDIKSYFKSCKKYRGMFFVEMKRQIALEYRKKGYKHREIASMIRLSTSMVTILLNTTKPLHQKDVEYVAENWREWVKEGLYPQTEYKYRYEGYDQFFWGEIKLVKAWEL